MTNNTPIRLPGKFGVLTQANPATEYRQFAVMHTAYLFYDFVLCADLNWCISAHSDDGPFAKQRMLEAFEQIKGNGIAIDPKDVFATSDYLITREKAHAMFPEEEVAETFFTEMHRLIESQRVALERYDGFIDLVRADQKIPAALDRVDIPLKMHDLHTALLIERNNSIARLQQYFTKNMLKAGAYEVDMDLRVGSYDDRGSFQWGRISLAPSDVEAPVLRRGDEFRTFALMLKSVPLPTDMSVDEFVDFRNSKTVRKSIGSFRKLAGDLIQGQAPTQYVVEELRSQYEDYKRDVRRSGAKTVIGNVKFLVSTLTGFAEDVVKLRLESLTKRPFEVVEYFLDRKYKDIEPLNSPFYFLYQKDRETP
jgi:hypothetical protein